MTLRRIGRGLFRWAPMVALLASVSASGGEGNWFLEGGISYAKPSYPGALQTTANGAGSNYTEIPVGYNLGAYYRLTYRLLLGASFFTLYDMYIWNATSGTTAAFGIPPSYLIDMSNLSASAQFYVLGEPGAGIFLRVDGGYGFEVNSSANAFSGVRTSEDGFAFLGALGGAFRLSKHVSFEGFVGYYNLRLADGVVSDVPVDLGIIVSL